MNQHGLKNGFNIKISYREKHEKNTIITITISIQP